MILFTADIHIKLGQKNVPKQWALNRYTMFFEQVYELEKQCDSHIIGGDIFDRIPSMEELELYFTFIRRVQIPTIIYPGNHEMVTKHVSFFNQLKQVSQDINPLVTIISDLEINDSYIILPYCDLHKKGIFEKIPKDRPLFTHVRGEIPPHVQPEIDLDLLKDFPIVFAGDLHAHSNTQRNIVYPGSPMTVDFHRTRVSTGCLIIDPDNDWDWEWKEIKLPQLIRKTVSKEEEMVPTEYDHTIYELQGSLTDLAGIENSDLLDKKVVRRSTEAALILTEGMSIEQELEEYLLYILQLEEESTKELLKVYNDYT